MNNFLLVAVGGAAGAATRYGLALLLTRLMHMHVIYATLTANLLGCLLLGFLWGLLGSRWGLSQPMMLLLGTGFLGGLTTFSTWQLEIAEATLLKLYLRATVYLVGSVVAGLSCTFLGIAIAWSISGSDRESLPLSRSVSSGVDQPASHLRSDRS